MKNTWTVMYCEGWDGPISRPVGHLTTEEALSRDAEGLPYSVLIAEDATPRFVLDIAWQQDYLARWEFDVQGRRDSRAVFLRLEDGSMFERKLTRWQYEGRDSDGDPSLPRRTFDRSLNGLTTIKDRHRSGGSGHRSKSEPTEQFMHAPVVFGEWGRFLGIEQEIREDSTSFVENGTDEVRPWNPPMPLEAPYLDQLLTEGATVVHEDSGSPMDVRHHHLGLLRLPTGKVVACDPTWLQVVEPFTVTVTPGDYPVIEIQIHHRADEYWAGAGYLLRISDQPTITWEMALRPGQDVRHLDDGHFFGFGVDGGQGCLLDDAAQTALLKHFDGDLYAMHDEMPLQEEFVIPGTDFNLFAYSCYYGDGSYPTWIGRDASGAVTCFLSDMLIIDNGQPWDDEDTFEQDW